MQENLRKCPGCHIKLSYQDYPADNRYGVHSAECRAQLDEILVKEGARFGYPAVHRLIIDSYWAQHPPHAHIQKELNIDQRFIAASIQSIGIHLIALHLSMVEKMELKGIRIEMDRIITKMNQNNISFDSLKAPEDLGSIKAADVNAAFTDDLSLDDYDKLAWQWAHAVWKAWEHQHATVRAWYIKYK
jgi:hypothetical protein